MPSQPLDHLILVGFKPVDTDTPSGKTAIRHLMDAANVTSDKIHFYPADTNVKTVLTETFRKDASKKKTKGFDIGNTICLVSRTLDKKSQHQLSLLKNVTVDVRSGLEDVDLENMTESNMLEWMRTGTYTSCLLYTSDAADDSTEV